MKGLSEEELTSGNGWVGDTRIPGLKDSGISTVKFTSRTLAPKSPDTPPKC